MAANNAQIQKPAPEFECKALIPGGEFKTIKLRLTCLTFNDDLNQIQFSDYKGKYVVLFFYPMDFTFVCPTEIVAFSEAASKFAAKNCVVLGASTGMLSIAFRAILISSFCETEYENINR